MRGFQEGRLHDACVPGVQSKVLNFCSGEQTVQLPQVAHLYLMPGACSVRSQVSQFQIYVMLVLWSHLEAYHDVHSTATWSATIAHHNYYCLSWIALVWRQGLLWHFCLHWSHRDPPCSWQTNCAALSSVCKCTQHQNLIHVHAELNLCLG